MFIYGIVFLFLYKFEPNTMKYIKKIQKYYIYIYIFLCCLLYIIIIIIRYLVDSSEVYNKYIYIINELFFIMSICVY
jgi:hypothetical protein